MYSFHKKPSLCRERLNKGIYPIFLVRHTDPRSAALPQFALFRLNFDQTVMYKTKHLPVSLFFAFLFAWPSVTPRLHAAEPPKPLEPVPSPAQLTWQEDELTLFTHFGMNTFTGR